MTIINDTTKPFDYASVYEYKSDQRSRAPKLSREIATVLPENNQLKLSFYYLIFWSKDIDFIDVVVTPNKKIANLKVQIDLDYCGELNINSYNADEYYRRNFTNIKANINYYLYIRLKYEQQTNITFSVKKMPSQPFNMISIAEYEDQSNAYPKYYSNQIISFEEVNNTLLTNITYDNVHNTTQYIILNFTSLYDIDYVFTQMQIGGVSTITYRIIEFNGSTY